MAKGLQGCCKGVVAEVHVCSRIHVGMSQGCCSSGAGVLQGCCRRVTGVSQVCCISGAGALQESCRAVGKVVSSSTLLCLITHLLLF